MADAKNPSPQPAHRAYGEIEVAFDYSVLDTATATTARAAVERISGFHRQLVTDVTEIGKALVQVKDCLGHGHFLPWLQAEFGWTERTAQNYMSVAQRFGPKSETLSYLPLSVIYRLASPSTPDDVRDQIIGRLDAGDALSPADIDGEIRCARREVKRQIEESKKSPLTRAKMKADRERRDLNHAAELAKYQEEREREDAARKAAADLIVERLNSDDLERLVALMDGRVRLGREDILEARSRGGVS